MTDNPQIHVYLNGQPVQLNLKYDPPVFYQPESETGYLSRDINGLPLQVGTHQSLVVLTVTGDTIFNELVSLTDRRQTLIFMGRFRDLSTATTPTKRVLYLNDEEANPVEGRTVARYVHAMPDLDSLDVYFSSKIASAPDLRIGYGNATPYTELPANVSGLVVTAAGDTNEVIMRIDQAFGLTGLFSTVVIRGGNAPHGNEPTPTTVVLNDRPIGLPIFSITSIFVQFVNGSRDSTLSLLPKGVIDERARVVMNGIEKVRCLPPRVSSPFWSITPVYHGRADWSFGYDCPDMRTPDSVYKFFAQLESLKRYNIVAMQANKLFQPDVFTHLLLLDTTSSPSDSRFGRVRFVNLSPDADVQVEGTTLDQGEVLFRDYGVGMRTLQVNGTPVSFEVDPDRPATVWFHAATQNVALPYSVTHD